MNRKIAVFALLSLLVTGTAFASAGGNGSGNPKNDRAWDSRDPNMQPAAIFIWRDGGLIRNPNHDAQPRSETGAVTVKQ